MFVDHPTEVALQLGLFGKEMRPVIAGLEAVAVEVVGDVNTRTRIAVLPPRSTGAGVLLEDGERNVGLPQPNTRQDSGLAATDDDYRQLRGAIGIQRGRPARIDTLEIHFLEEQRQVAVRHALAGRPVHHLPDELRRKRSWLRAAAVAIVGDHRQRFRAGAGLVFLGHEALDFVEEDPGGFEVAHEAGITGDVHQRQEQRGNADLLECSGNVGGGGGERLARVTTAHQGDPFASSMSACDQRPDYDTQGFVIGVQPYARRRT